VKEIRAKKSLGQHFLRDDEVHEDFLRWAQLCRGDHILEIGAGDGTITRSLAAEAAKVIAVETDRRCLGRLRSEFPPGGVVEVIEADILTYDLGGLSSIAPLKAVGDLPYNIATAVLNRLLEHRDLFTLMVLMFQKEVARRLTATEGTKEYGSLSLATRHRADVEIIRVVPPEAFRPPPKVESALVRVVPRSTSPLTPAEERVFARLISCAFAQRRKTMVNSLARSGFAIPTEKVIDIIKDISIDPRVRAEQLSYGQFIELSRRLAGKE
jgi:16S rRNA (adenine1518-N6/adenine1519-N6)-dimethyltransferase